VTSIVCTDEPDVADTVIVDVPAGVPADPLLPHEVIVIAASSTTVKSMTGASRIRRFFPPSEISPTTTITASANVQSVHWRGADGFRFPNGSNPPRAVVAIENVVEVTVLPGVKDGGEKLGVDNAGSPDAEKVIGLLYPPGAGVIVIVKFAV